MENIKFNKKLLDHFLNGDYSRTDYRRMVRSFARPDDILMKHMQDHWESIAADQPLDDRMSRMLQFLKIHTAIVKSVKRRSFLSYYQKIAAMLLIPLLLGLGYCLIGMPDRHEAMATIHSPLGARTDFILPDGTTGRLNSGSELTYPVQFSNKREVKLQGEAYFNVVHQHGNKFRVKTNTLTVEVLGTSFNVAAYSGDPEISVILKEGRVKILDMDDKESYIMKPDEKFCYNSKKRRMTVTAVNASDQTSWTQGILKFCGESLEKVMRELGRWYNVDFEIRDKQLQEYNFKATFKDEQLDEILRMISLTTPMKYRIEERKTDANGIYKKKKIIIERK